MHDQLSTILKTIKSSCGIPVILFPGNNLQINREADAILLLSLISGRNPELLIGRHVISAPILKNSGLEVISTGYLLIDSGKTTTVNYMSQTMPIPREKSDIAACTAMAGEMLGMKLIYLDAGSGAGQPVPADMIRTVRNSVSIPVIVGGGITGATQAKEAFRAGADVVVAGNAIEKDPGLIPIIASTRTSYSN
jgi:putative glycerol-1-phosphate prenyltransferase